MNHPKVFNPVKIPHLSFAAVLKWRAASLFLVIILSGCQAMVYGTASDFEKIQTGMTKEEVIEILGSPVSVAADADKDEEYLIYKRMKHAVSSWARTYKVTLRDGVVVRYGEQYEEKNINVY